MTRLIRHRPGWLLLLALILLALPLAAVAANLGKWNAPNSTTFLSTELNSLANNTHTAGGSNALTNQTSLAIYGDCELFFKLNGTQTPSPGADATVWIQAAYDGTNYAHTTAQTSNQILTVFALDSSLSEQRVIARNLVFPPLLFRLALANHSGSTMNGGGSTLACSLYHVNTNG